MKVIIYLLFLLLFAVAVFGFCPETFVDGEESFTLTDGGRTSWSGDLETDGQGGYYCNYHLMKDETSYCETDLEKKIGCDGKSSKTRSVRKAVANFDIRFVSNPEKYERTTNKREYCTGKEGWWLTDEYAGLGTYEQIADSYFTPYYNKYYTDSQIHVRFDGSPKVVYIFHPEDVKTVSDELKAKVPGLLNCEACNDHNEPFSVNGCVDKTCNNNDVEDLGENCRYCSDANCGDGLCVVYNDKWQCLTGAKTYSTVNDVDEGIVFVKRSVNRGLEIPLRKGDRLMDGDEIILKKWPERDEHTYVQIEWDDGTIGVANFNRYSGESYGSFFVGTRRNDSENIGGEKVFVEPPYIEMSDVANIGIQILTNLPQVNAGVSIWGTILLSPINEVGSMTYVNVKSDFLLEPVDGGWTLYTFEGSPEVVRLEDDEVISKVIVEPGYKSVVSASDVASEPIEFDGDDVKPYIEPEYKRPSFLWLKIVGLIVIIVVVLIGMKKKKK